MFSRLLKMIFALVRLGDSIKINFLTEIGMINLG